MSERGYDVREPGYESGPFCSHWGEMGCEKLCVCKHRCEDHEDVGDGDCRAVGCECLEFKDPPKKEATQGTARLGDG